MRSVVAKRSVALPFPSSPHWAPRTTIAGIGPPAERALSRPVGGARADATIPHGGLQPGPVSARVPAVDPLLVITNAEAGTADEEALEAALAIMRESCSVDVQATSNPGELDGVLQRRASRRIVVAGGDGSLHAVVAALHRRHD